MEMRQGLLPAPAPGGLESGELARMWYTFTRSNGGDLASTWVAKPEVHAEAQITS